jgi:PAS domain S-box-containing protein
VDNLSFPKAQLLLRIFSQKEEDLNIQLNQALEWSTKELGMDLGIISHIQDDSYTIKKFWPISDGLEEDQKFELGNTYCSLAIKKDDVFFVNNMAESEFSEQSCYQKFKLEAYIGKQFHLNGTLYGTLNFSSVAPNKDGFNDDEAMFVRLLSGWVASTIHRIDILKALQEEHRLYKLISTNSAEMICMHKMDGTYTYVSPSVKNLLGYSPHELIGSNPYDIFHPDDLKRIAEESHTQATEGNASPTIQYRIRKKDGSFIWFDTATQPVVENGEVIALQTTSREVTERKRLELLFLQSQNMANVGGWEFNLKTNELFWTEQVYHIHELDPSVPITVEKALTYYPSESREKVEFAMSEAIANGDTYDLELPFNTEKGNNIWVRVIVKAEFLGMEATHLYGTFQEITKKKRLEEFFKETQNMAHVGGWEYDLESGDLFWTDEVYRIHELPVGTPVKVEDGLSYYPEGFSRDSIVAALEYTQKTGEPYDIELPFVTAKGNEIWVKAIGHAELIDGKAVKLKGAFQDITRRKENEEKIKS